MTKIRKNVIGLAITLMLVGLQPVFGSEANGRIEPLCDWVGTPVQASSIVILHKRMDAAINQFNWPLIRAYIWDGADPRLATTYRVAQICFAGGIKSRLGPRVGNGR